MDSRYEGNISRSVGNVWRLPKSLACRYDVLNHKKKNPFLISTFYFTFYLTVGEPETRQECLLNNNKNSDFCAPLTSFDWNEVDPNLLGTSSIDTTCTIWGLETGQVLGRVNMVSGHVKTQLIAHDKEVYDIAFSKAGGGRDMFASVGADGKILPSKKAILNFL